MNLNRKSQTDEDLFRKVMDNFKSKRDRKQTVKGLEYVQERLKNNARPNVQKQEQQNKQEQHKKQKQERVKKHKRHKQDKVKDPDGSFTVSDLPPGWSRTTSAQQQTVLQTPRGSNLSSQASVDIYTKMWGLPPLWLEWEEMEVLPRGTRFQEEVQLDVGDDGVVILERVESEVESDSVILERVERGGILEALDDSVRILESVDDSVKMQETQEDDLRVRETAQGDVRILEAVEDNVSTLNSRTDDTEKSKRDRKQTVKGLEYGQERLKNNARHNVQRQEQLKEQEQEGSDLEAVEDDALILEAVEEDAFILEAVEDDVNNVAILEAVEEDTESFGPSEVSSECEESLPGVQSPGPSEDSRATSCSPSVESSRRQSSIERTSSGNVRNSLESRDSTVTSESRSRNLSMYENSRGTSIQETNEYLNPKTISFHASMTSCVPPSGSLEPVEEVRGELWLPPGWVRRSRVRQGGAKTGCVDWSVVTSEGRVLRSQRGLDRLARERGLGGLRLKGGHLGKELIKIGKKTIFQKNWPLESNRKDDGVLFVEEPEAVHLVTDLHSPKANLTFSPKQQVTVQFVSDEVDDQDGVGEDTVGGRRSQRKRRRDLFMEDNLVKRKGKVRIVW